MMRCFRRNAGKEQVCIIRQGDDVRDEAKGNGYIINGWFGKLRGYERICLRP